MSLDALRLLLVSLPLATVSVACGGPVPRQPSEEDHSEAIHDSVERFFGSIPGALEQEGPIAWLGYFEDGPDFFMASDGALVFPTADSAEVFVRGLARKISSIQLRWIDMRVAAVGPGVAVVGAAYRETVTDTAGVAVEFGGFMTGVARHHQEGWRIQNLHWSSPVPARE